MYNSAVIKGDFRYRLDRGTRGRSLAVIMVNPSTADATNDDPTIRKVLGFAERLSCKHVIVGNKFAYRATQVNDLRRVDDPVGPENDHYLEQIMLGGDLCVVAWGSLAKLPKHLQQRWYAIVRLANKAGVSLYCLGRTADGHPRHPLMTPYSTPLTLWKKPRTS